MSYYQNPKTSLVGYVSSLAAITIPEADVTFTNVKPASAEEITKHGRNSRCVINFVPTSTVASGSSYLWFDRLDLAILAKMVLVPRSADLGNSVYDLLADIKAMTAIPFTSDDLVETFVTDLGNGKFNLVLTAKPTSIGWIGTVNIPFNPVPDISTAFKANTLNLF